MFIYSIGMYLIGLGFIAVGSGLDIYTSTLFKKYGLTEGNDFFRDSHNLMNLNLALIVAGAILIIQAVCFFGFGGDVGFFANLLCYGFGLYRIVQGWRNYDLIQKKKRQRKA